MTKTLLVPVLLCLWCCACSTDQETEPPVVVSVRTVGAVRDDVGVTVDAPAVTQAHQQARVAARITAPIDRLEARFGDRVRGGQVLARLVRSDLEAQRAEAAAAVTSAEAALAKLTAGTLPADVERARGQVEITAAALDEAEKIYKRRAELFQEGAIMEREVILSRTQYEQAKTTHRVAQRSLDLLLKTSREQDMRIARSQLEEARARLAYLDTQLDFTEIRSPFDGTITEQFLYPGDMTKPDTPIFTLMDLAVVIASGQFPEDQALPIHPGQACWFLPADQPEKRFKGVVSVVNQAVDAARRTVNVWCEIGNAGGSLKAGQFGSVTVLTATHPDAVLVPIEAVQFEEGTRQGVVWTVDADGKARGKTVTTGVSEDGRVEIVQGLDGRETVIVSGGFGLSDGTAVEAAKEKPAGESGQ